MLYIVPSSAEAVRMFETVNDRRRPLTNLEKTKSILMYASYLVVDDREILETRLSELNNHFSEIYRFFQGIEEGFGLRDAGETQRITTSALGKKTGPAEPYTTHKQGSTCEQLA